MVRYFNHGSNLFVQRNTGCLAVVKGQLMPYIKQKRTFAEKSEGGEPAAGPAKEEKMNLKMPGFVHPDNIKEEGYFTQKAKRQLEELKRKPETPPVTRPEGKL